MIGIQPTMQSALVAGERLNEIFDLDQEKMKKRIIKYLLKNYQVKSNVQMLHFVMEHVKMY